MKQFFYEQQSKVFTSDDVAKQICPEAVDWSYSRRYNIGLFRLFWKEDHPDLDSYRRSQIKYVKINSANRMWKPEWEDPIVYIGYFTWEKMTDAEKERHQKIMDASSGR